MALASNLMLNACPDNSVCALNMPATALTTTPMVTASKITAAANSHNGTEPAARRVIMATGEVNGTRLNTTESIPFESLINVLIKINGTIIGMIITVVA